MSPSRLPLILLAAAGIGVYLYPPSSMVIGWAIVGAVVVVAWRCWLWLCRRHPLVAICIHGFLSGLLGGRRKC